MTDIFDGCTLRPSTRALYTKNLLTLNNHREITSPTFLKDHAKVMQKIAHLKPTTQRGYIIAAVTYLKCQPKQKKTTQLIEQYTKTMNEMNAQLRTNNTKSDSESDNWMTQEELKEKYNELKEDIARFEKRKTLSEQEYQRLLQYIVLSLYYLTPPRRNSDYQNMKFGDSSDSSEYNYIDIPNERFIFNNYKTSKTYKQQLIDIPPHLMDAIRTYLRHVPEHAEFFLSRQDGQPLRHVNAITRILNTAFGRRVGSSLLRKMYHTSKYADVMDELEKDAEKMGHSVDVVKSHYLKK